MIAEPTYESLNRLALWHDMATITLDEMQRVKLMNRIDTKYVLHVEEVMQLIAHLARYGYRVQVLGAVRAARYDTLYYDTPQRHMYLVHHNRQLTRQKVRTRTYRESDVTYLEIKNKSNNGRTRKRRMELPRGLVHNFGDDAAAAAFYAEKGWHALDDLTPALSTRFTRITLVNPALTERLTIDLGLCYEDVRSGRGATIAEMCIVELKQDGLCPSTAKSIMQHMRITPLKVSKYCLGTALTVEGIKRNRFQEKLRYIAKRLGGLEIVTTAK